MKYSSQKKKFTLKKDNVNKNLYYEATKNLLETALKRYKEGNHKL